MAKLESQSTGRVVVAFQDDTKPDGLSWAISDAWWQFCFYFHSVMNEKQLGKGKTHRSCLAGSIKKIHFTLLERIKIDVVK